MSSEIVPFFSGTNVLVTGGTGLIGGLITEKLLRVCDDIGGIYFIVRSKKGKSIAERVESVTKEPLFDRLRQSKSDFASKIHAVEGDITLKGLGLSQDNRQLLACKINVIFHCAASLDMTAKLKTSLVSNIQGLNELLDLCHEMPNLKSMVFVSTAYSQCTRPVIEEKLYPPPIEPATLLQLAKEFDDKTLEDITPGLLGPWPNTYTYTKAVAEKIVSVKGCGLPIGIFRPSIVMNTFSEPMPGWISNIYGPVGVLAASGAGLMRVHHIPASNRFDYVPADYCANAAICSAWEINRKWTENKERQPDPALVPVYNYSSGPSLRMNWTELTKLSEKHEFPLEKRLWIVTTVITRCKYYHDLLWLLLHTVPALLIDTYAYLKGKKPSMMKIYQRITKHTNAISYFGWREWEIMHDRTYSLWNRLNDNDRKLFPFDMYSLDKKDFIAACCIGIKLYVFKETMERALEAQASYRRQMKIYRTAKSFVKVFMLYIAYRIISCIYNVIVNVTF